MLHSWKRGFPRVSPALLIILALALNVLIKAIHLTRVSRDHIDSSFYTYIGMDYPERWPIQVGEVMMELGNTVRYSITTPEGAEEWKQLVPGDGLVYLGPEKRPFSISMLHQLRCLDIIREGLTGVRGPSDAESWELVRHCMNYERQMILCRDDAFLEPFNDASNIRSVDEYGVAECRDWGDVYREVHRNRDDHEAAIETNNLA